jgi:hypothetical protein
MKTIFHPAEWCAVAIGVIFLTLLFSGVLG